MEGKVVDNKLLLDGYIYVKSRSQKGRTYWDCRRLRRRECTARAVTTDADYAFK